MTGKTSVVTAAYCRNFAHTGFLPVRTTQFYSGQSPLLDQHDFFQPTAILHWHTVLIHLKSKKPALFLVLYDLRERKDGTFFCDYLAMKLGKDNIVEDVDRENIALVGHRITERFQRHMLDQTLTEDSDQQSWLRIKDKTNAVRLRLVDDVSFVVCLDDAAPGRDGVGALARNGEKREDLAAPSLLCSNFLCGTHDLQEASNSLFDSSKSLFAAGVFTEGLMLLTHSINPSAPTLFHTSLSPHAKSFKPPKSTANGNLPVSSQSFSYDTSPSRLIWTLTSSIRGGIRYPEA
ncbi:hypothetical protein EDD22DRAFT_953373 [Suillus occidentalis]|nr:hypothetical protein EDD22DRAFT_953373 [Suillus occidentalis]